jgi:hypothetical protein
VDLNVSYILKEHDGHELLLEGIETWKLVWVISMLF